MNKLRHSAYALLIALFFSVSTLVAVADEDDPPGRAVDIRYITGQVSIQPGGVDDWAGAVVNRPLTTADRIWADRDSRAELQLGSASLRLNSETSLTFTNVSDQTVQVELDQGTLNLRVRRLYDGEIYEVDTPNLAFTLTRSGVYRFDVDPNEGTTRVTVSKGEGEATGEGNAVRLRAGEQAYFDNGTSLENQITRADRSDGFDDWARLRDEREDRSQSYRYVSQDMVGAQDLDEYGTWRSDPEYGSMWVPSHVQRGWAPYHDGHWAWVDPWGWTWVDDQPWGYAPSHYGRWVHREDSWGWCPGPVDVRPVYAPALVAWVGGAAWGASASFGGGEGVGWFPLGYGEPYVPSYRASRGYFENVNTSNTRITNITNVTNTYYVNNSVNNSNNVNNINNANRIRYANQNVPGAVIAVPRTAMVNAQPVSRVAVRVPTADVGRSVVAVATAPPIAPERRSLLGAKADVRAAAPPQQQTATPRAVITKSAPPPRVVPFAAKQDALAKNPGRPLDTQAVQQIRARLPEQPKPAPAPTRPAGQPRPANNGQPSPANNSQPERNAGAPGNTPNAPGNRNTGAPERPNTPPQQNNANQGNPNGANPVRNPNVNNGAPDRNVPRPPNSNVPANNGQPVNNPQPGTNPGNQPTMNNGPDRPGQRPQNGNQPGNERTPVVERAPANDRPPSDRSPNDRQQPNARPQNNPESNPNARPVPRPPDAERNAAPPQRQQASPQSRPEPPARNEPTPDRPAARPPQPERNTAPPPREQASPQPHPQQPVRNEPPPERQVARPPQPERNTAPPPREQASPQQRPQQPVRNEPPPERQMARPPQPERNTAPPPREQDRPESRPQPPAHNGPPPERPAVRPPQPDRNPPPPDHNPPPQGKDKQVPPEDRQ